MASTIRGSDNFDSAGGNAVKAWVNFNGTGTVAIRAAFNVSSITDNGTGDYTVNFTNALTDANYSCASTASTDSASWTFCNVVNSTYMTTASVRINFASSAAAYRDPTVVNLSVLR